jgi:hypothetical protein
MYVSRRGLPGNATPWSKRSRALCVNIRNPDAVTGQISTHRARRRRGQAQWFDGWYMSNVSPTNDRSR